MTPILLRTQSDVRLLSLATHGHDRAFEAIVERYRKPLFRYVRRLLSEPLAEDVVQATFLNAWRALQAGADVCELRPWLYRIGHNQAINALKRAGAALDPLPENASLAPVELGPDDVIELRDEMRLALEGVAALPERQRAALLAVAVQGRPHADVARELGLTHGAVRQLVYRARTSLRAVASAITPAPLIGPVCAAHEVTAARVAELAAGAAGAGVAGFALKAGAVAVTAGAVAAGAPGPAHEQPVSKVARAPAGRAAAPAAAPPAVAVVERHRAASRRSGGARHGAREGSNDVAGSPRVGRARHRGTGGRSSHGARVAISSQREGPADGSSSRLGAVGDDNFAGVEQPAAVAPPASDGDGNHRGSETSASDGSGSGAAGSDSSGGVRNVESASGGHDGGVLAGDTAQGSSSGDIVDAADGGEPTATASPPTAAAGDTSGTGGGGGASGNSGP